MCAQLHCGLVWQADAKLLSNFFAGKALRTHSDGVLQSFAVPLGAPKTFYCRGPSPPPVMRTQESDAWTGKGGKYSNGGTGGGMGRKGGKGSKGRKYNTSGNGGKGHEICVLNFSEI